MLYLRNHWRGNVIFCRGWGIDRGSWHKVPCIRLDACASVPHVPNQTSTCYWRQHQSSSGFPSLPPRTGSQQWRRFSNINTNRANLRVRCTCSPKKSCRFLFATRRVSRENRKCKRTCRWGSRPGIASRSLCWSTPWVRERRPMHLCGQEDCRKCSRLHSNDASSI